jgi:dihydrolipoamide dehydrogenase
LKERLLPVEGAKLNLPQMLRRGVVSCKVSPRASSFFSNKQGRLHQGNCLIVSPNTISVQPNEGGESTVEAKNVITATGPEVTPFPGRAIEIDEEQFVSSTGALSLQNV